MQIPVFLSYSMPYNKNQEKFIKSVMAYLKERGFQTRTLGVTDYDMKNPLTAIRRMMIESNGMLTIAFRRVLIEKGKSKPNPNLPGVETLSLDGKWLTSSYCHIEAAMAFQVGLPILVFREKGVIAEGMLEGNVSGTYMPEFDLEQEKDFFKSQEWKQLIAQWEGYVRRVYEMKGYPPRLY